ncbi:MULTISPECIES: hypothetical protein [Mumia]|uniref:hypothetical protein n=1 Tax=Mumia TaxID=1546255 RepID=UPI00142338DC|nr:MULTISPECIES: hypothetical protein [unclassified Mumia]QMW64897.1 hypothetical protein H4N58_11670 [Mumia sp. ZJ1417]
MRIDYAVIAAAAAVLTGVGGAAAVVQVSSDADPSTQLPSATSPAPTSTSAPTASTTTAATTATTAPASADPSTSPTTTAADPATTDALSEENVIRERLYYDVTRHSFTQEQTSFLPLGPCTGDLELGDAIGDDVTRIDAKLVGAGGRYVIEQLAETDTPNLAAQAAETIVTLVDECEAIQGGDFGYGDPVLVSSEPHHMIWYFPAFDSDSVAGGYAVFNVGKRVGVLEVNDAVGEKKVELLAKEAARIAGD